MKEWATALMYLTRLTPHYWDRNNRCYVFQVETSFIMNIKDMAGPNGIIYECQRSLFHIGCDSSWWGGFESTTKKICSEAEHSNANKTFFYGWMMGRSGNFGNDLLSIIERIEDIMIRSRINCLVTVRRRRHQHSTTLPFASALNNYCRNM